MIGKKESVAIIYEEEEEKEAMGCEMLIEKELDLDIQNFKDLDFVLYMCVSAVDTKMKERAIVDNCWTTGARRKQ